MADRPILFSAPMIRAILAGRKTQTRRVLSPRNTYRDGYPWHRNYPWEAHDWNDAWIDPGPSPAGNLGPYLKVAYPEDNTRHRIYPLVAPGDRLWVRETLECANGDAVGYPADKSWLPNTPWTWKRRSIPSIHMPRWASRITLLVTDVRIQRLHDISEADAVAEGVPDFASLGAVDGKDIAEASSRLRWPQRWFSDLWNSINGPGAWEGNPWVMAVTFRTVLANIDEVK